MSSKIFALVFNWYSLEIQDQLIKHLPQFLIEETFEDLGLDFKDVFFKRKTWSRRWLSKNAHLLNTEIWDYISIYYTLPLWFCTRHIDQLNFHDLVLCQILTPEFKLANLHRVDWIPKTNRKAMRELIASWKFKLETPIEG